LIAEQAGGAPSNKRMQLTKLRAAPVLRAEVPPCAPAGRMDGGTASQLIRGVRRLVGGAVKNRLAGALALGALLPAALPGTAGQPPAERLTIVAQVWPSVVPMGQWTLEMSDDSRVVVTQFPNQKREWTISGEVRAALQRDIVASGVLSLTRASSEHPGEDPPWCGVTVEIGKRVVRFDLEPPLRMPKEAVVAWRSIKAAVGLEGIYDGGCSGQNEETRRRLTSGCS